METGSFARYLSVTAATTAVLLTAVAGINWLVDPLWNAGGNKLFGQNYSFNERHAKINLLLDQGADRFDCVIFGSSRATLLNHHHIRSHRCFNLSFSDATPVEMAAFARYVRKLGLRPRRAIIAVDERNFSRRHLAEVIPEFVREGTPPPSRWSVWLSLDTLDFSLRTLLRRPPRPRYYDSRFIGRVVPGTPPYRIRDCYSAEDRGRPYTTRHLRFYREIMAAFPKAEWAGYAPLISAWDMAVLAEDGSLASYLDTQYAVSRLFTRYFDFSVPSPLTTDPANGYDGQHFLPRINDHIVHALETGESPYGLALHRLTREEYGRRFKHALEEFRRTHRVKLRLSPECGRRPVIR